MRHAIGAATITLLMLALSSPTAMAAGWDGIDYLVGEWVADGGGQAGAPTGSFSFHYDAGGKVLTRHNVADYPAMNGKPASHHEDLLVVYRESESGPLLAVYFDSEGHVIHYAVDAAADGTARFVSEAQGSGPRFRLTYKKSGDDGVVGDFEIAPPGQAEFKPYLHWTAHRAKK
jgi:hypothetical protein